MRARRTVLGLLVLMANGCVSTGVRFPQAPVGQPDADSGVIYIYRVPGGHAAAVPLAVFLDGRKIVSLGQNGFTWVRVPPGGHTVGGVWSSFVSAPQVQLNGQIRAGTVTYLEFSATYDTLRIRSMSDVDAKKAMQSFGYDPATP